ncbi:hypothetical protein IAD21_01728 [Abditibacteriota bacterium]|nr:hypothetical protein IAD21_01728 [Abditibacteriota bacterium]
MKLMGFLVVLGVGISIVPSFADIRTEARLNEEPDYRKKMEAEAPALIDKANARLQELVEQEKALGPMDDEKQQNIFVEKVVALRERADQLVLQRRYKVARMDYATAASYAHRIKSFQKDREADCLVDKAFCSYQLHRFDDALADLQNAQRARASIADDFEFLANLARVQVATEHFDESIATSQRIRSRLKELVQQSAIPGLKLGEDAYTFEKANSYIIESGALFLKGDAEAALAQWRASNQPDLLDSNPFDVQQAVLNAAIARNPTDVEARLARARYFQKRAKERREAVANFAPAASRFNSGGLFNRIEIENLDVQPYTFDEAALFDFDKARQLRADAATLTGHFLAAKSFNTVAPKGRSVSLQSLWDEESKIQALGHQDATLMRAIGLQLGENALALPDTAPTKGDDLANAARYFSFALFASPQGADAVDNRAWVKKLMSARFQMTPAATPPTPPQTALDWKKWGNQALAQQNERVALAAYSDAIALDPNFADAYSNRGNVYFGMGHLEAALEASNKAIALDPKHRVAYHNRAMIWNALFDAQKASEDEGKAVEFAPDDATRALYLSVRARFLRDANQLPAASAEVKRALDLAPSQSNTEKRNLATIWAIRAEIELEMGDDQGALTSLQTAQKADDKNRRAGFLLALLMNLSPTPQTLNAESKKLVETLLPFSGGIERQTFAELTERLLKNSPTLKQNPNAPIQTRQILGLLQRYDEENGL